MRPLLLLLLAATLPLAAQPNTFFEEKVRPVLAENCYSCHTEARTAGLRVDSRDALLKGGASGPAIIPGNPGASLLITALSHTHAKLKMPPGRKLPEPQIQALRQWIQAGAPWPATPVKANPKSLWSLAPIPLPARGSIDQLTNPKAPAPTPSTLIRRITFDLTGLPPTFEEVQAFERQPDLRQLTNRLLATPQFGERWARHWLDVARYAEDDVRGLGQAEYPNAWRYRDWVVQAFNEDLPYNQFIGLQIAADLQPRPNRDDRAALGLFSLGPWYYSNAPPPEARADERHDRVDVLTRGFLGLTVACARCHDHKFDPISTRDYYALAGVFARTQYTEYPLSKPAEVQAWDQRKQRIEALETEIKDFLQDQARQLAEILARDTAIYLTAPETLDPDTAARWKKYLAKPTHEHPFLAPYKQNPTPQAAAEFQDLVLQILAEKKEVDANNEAAIAPTRPKKNAPKTRLPNGFTTYDEFCPGCSVIARSLPRDRYMLWSDLFQPSGKTGGILFFNPEEIEKYLQGPWKTHLLNLRAELAARKKALPEQYAFLHAIGERQDAVPLRIHIRGNAYNLGDPAPQRFLEVCGAQPLDQGSGRIQLAEAVARSPLAARVAVNRIWGHLTGQYLVGTPSNFGTLGDKPTNPQLLDYLAARFIESGYSTKSLITGIIQSQTYQRLTPRRRHDAESVRDAMLKAANLWNPQIGGPSIDLAKDRTRRSIYGRISRFRLDDSLVLFDFPSPSITSEKRNVTHVPQQQLFFLNSPFVADVAAAIAEKTQDIATAYRMILTRNPTGDELIQARAFLKSATFAELSQVLLTTNEFHFID